MGWNSTGKFGIHSGKTLRRYPTRKNVAFTNNSNNRRNEFAVVKELKYGNRAQNVDPKTIEFDFEDGGLPLENHSLIYSLNKHKRWLLPELLKENVSELFDDEIDDLFNNIPETKDKTKKRKKEKKRKADTKLRVSVVERYSSAEALRYRPDCIGVTSNAPLDSPNPERKPGKKYSHVGDLKSKVSGEDIEVYYEFLSPFPKEAWPSNRQFRNYRRNSVDEVVGSKSKKKGKGKRNKCYLHGGHRDETFEGFDECGSFYACDDDVLREHSSEPLNNEFTFPIGAYIRDAIEAKNMKNTAEINLETNEPASTLPPPIVYGKGQVIYTDNIEIPNFSPSEIKDYNQTVSKCEPLSKDQKFNINLLAEDIAPDGLSNTFGNNYIEGDISPRKFIIKADINEFNEAQPNNDIDNLCLLFEVSDTPKNQNTVEVTVAFSLPKPELIPNTLNSMLESELNRLQNGSSLTVKTIIEFLMEKISTQANTAPKRLVSLKNSAMKVPVEFIQQVCKQESEVCDLKTATQFALGSLERIDVACSVSRENGISSCGNEKLFCEICYVEEDVQSIDQSDFTRLLHCSHQFCNCCWSLYIESSIKAGQSHITCPHFSCKTTIPEPLIWSNTNSKLYQQHRKMTLQNLISTNPQFRNCPTADCTHLAYIEGLDKNQPNSIPVLCKCGLVWCFACQNQAHWPASCMEMEVFRKEFKNRGEYIKMLCFPGSVTSVYVKRCPFCCHPIEKSFGCNHMSCWCGREFCWDCLTSWDDHDWRSCVGEKKKLEEVELTVSCGSAKYDKYCKIALRNGFERNGKNFFAFKHLKEKAKRVENAHEFVTHNPKTSTCKFVQNYIEKNVASMVEDIFHFKNVAHFVLENTAAYLAITKTTKTVRSLDRTMELLDFIVQRCNEVLLEPVVLLKEGKLEAVQELLKRGEELVWNIDRLVQANRKE